MIRRTFLKALAGVPLFVRAAAEAKPAVPYEPQTYAVDPLGLFERIDFRPGYATEFPLDLLPTGSPRPPAFICPSWGRTPEVARPFGNHDCVYVPTYDVGFCGWTREACVAGVKDKLRHDAVSLLLTAGWANAPLRPGTADAMAREATGRLGCKVEWFVARDHLVAVAAKPRRHDRLVLCVRSDTEVFDDPTHYRNPTAIPPYFGWGEFGPAVLDSSVVLAGKVIQ